MSANCSLRMYPISCFCTALQQGFYIFKGLWNKDGDEYTPDNIYGLQRKGLALCRSLPTLFLEHWLFYQPVVDRVPEWDVGVMFNFFPSRDGVSQCCPLKRSSFLHVVQCLICHKSSDHLMRGPFLGLISPLLDCLPALVPVWHWLITYTSFIVNFNIQWTSYLVFLPCFPLRMPWLLVPLHSHIHFRGENVKIC